MHWSWRLSFWSFHTIEWWETRLLTVNKHLKWTDICKDHLIVSGPLLRLVSLLIFWNCFNSCWMQCHLSHLGEVVKTKSGIVSWELILQWNKYASFTKSKINLILSIPTITANQKHVLHKIDSFYGKSEYTIKSRGFHSIFRS